MCVFVYGCDFFQCHAAAIIDWWECCLNVEDAAYPELGIPRIYSQLCVITDII